MNAATSVNRRALGLSKRRRYRPGNALLGIGVLLMAVGAYVAGTGRSSDEPAEAEPTVTTITAPPSTGQTTTGQTTEVPAVRSVDVPAGHQAIAVTLPFTAGGAGYVGAGDKVNVFAVDPANGAPSLLLQGVGVLDVSTEVEPRIVSGSAERGSTAQLTYLLAVADADVARVIAAVGSQSVYVSMLPRAASPAASVDAARVESESTDSSEREER